LVNTLLTQTKNLNNFGNEVSSDLYDDSYDSLKFLNYIHYLNFKNIISIDNNIINPIPYTQVIDNFRADYDDQQWLTSSAYSDSKFSNYLQTISQNEVRTTNPIKLRSTAKNSIVTYSAIQKVFRSRYDEGRANVRMQDLANSYEPYPFITSNRVSYENLLSKNKTYFFNVNNYNHQIMTNFNEIYSI